MIFKESGKNPFKNTRTCIKITDYIITPPPIRKTRNSIPPSHKNVLCKEHDIDGWFYCLYVDGA